MGKHDRTTPPAADPKSGRNPGYAETEPRDLGDVTRPAPRPRPNPDEPGMTRDPDAGPRTESPPDEAANNN